MHTAERRVIGIDVDGVLADFVTGFNQKLVEVTGRDLLGANYTPTVWDWPQHAGYTADEIAATKGAVRWDRYFWLGLSGYDNVPEVLNTLVRLKLDVYFITDRFGRTAKNQTERWLHIQHLAASGYCPAIMPTVLVTPHKGLACQTLGITHYIDDNEDNCLEAMQAGARTFICDRPWNHTFSHRDIERTGLQGFLDAVR